MFVTRENRMTRRILGMLLVVVGVLIWTRVTEEVTADAPPNSAQPRERASDEADLEVAPLVPRGRILDASWRKDSAEDQAAAEETPEAESERSDWNRVEEDAGARARREASLRGVLKRVGGLGVHVATGDDPDDEDEDENEDSVSDGK